MVYVRSGGGSLSVGMWRSRGARDAHCPSFGGWWRVLRLSQICMMFRCFRCRGEGHKIENCVAVTGLSDAAAMVAGGLQGHDRGDECAASRPVTG